MKSDDEYDEKYMAIKLMRTNILIQREKNI